MPTTMCSLLGLVKNYDKIAHLDKFKENKRAYSEEQEKCFHQDILKFERRYIV